MTVWYSDDDQESEKCEANTAVGNDLDESQIATIDHKRIKITFQNTPRFNKIVSKFKNFPGGAPRWLWAPSTAYSSHIETSHHFP